MSGNRTQLGWLAVNPHTVPSSHRAKNPLEAVLIWMMLLTPRQPLRYSPSALRTSVTIMPTFSTVCLSFSGVTPSSFVQYPEFVFLVNIDPVPIPVIALRCVVGHSTLRSPFGMATDS